MAITLKAARINAGLTQAEAANKLGISIPTLIAYEAEKRYPDVPVIKKIEGLYGVLFANIFFAKC